MSVVRKVPKLVALNPVAVAVAYTSLMKTARDIGLHLHMHGEGTKLTEPMMGLNELLALAMIALEQKDKKDTPDYRVMRGAQSALIQLSEEGFVWRAKYGIPLDEGLKRALDVLGDLRPVEVRKAWLSLKLL